MCQSRFIRILSVISLLLLLPVLACSLSALSIPEVRLWAFGCPDKDHITEVILSRSICFGTCPSYKILLRRDGTALYRGLAYVTLKGDNIGTIDKDAFERLAEAIQSRGYFKLLDYYTDNLSDGPTYNVSVVCDGVRKNIFEYDGAGPFELEKIENTIDSVAKPVKWQTWKWAGPPAPDPFNSAEWPGPSYFMMDL